MPMKILMVNRSASQEGGVESYLAGVSRHLSRHGVEVSLLHGESETQSGDTPYQNERAIPELWSRDGIELENALGSVNKCMEECSPDLVYLHDVDSGLVTSHMSMRLPTVKYVHGFKETCPDGKRLLQRPSTSCPFPLSAGCFVRAHTRRCMPRSPKKALNAYLRASRNLVAIRRLPLVLVASRFMKEVLVTNGVSEKKIGILPYFCRLKCERWQPPARPSGLLFVGRLVLAKGIVAFLDVLKEMDRKVTLDIVGDGPERDNLESKIRALGMQHRVTICGWLDGEKLKECYRRNAVLIVPSLWPEPFGMVGIEAASCCRPAVAFDVGGISDWLHDGATGFIVKAEQFGEFRARIEALLDSPEKARQMGVSGQQEAAERYSVETHLRDLLSQLGRIGEGSRS